MGKQIADLRKHYGYTQTEFGELLGLSRDIINAYERGRIRLNSQIIIKMSEVLHISADKILGLEPIPEINRSQSLRIAKRLRLIEQLPEARQKVLLSTIDNYLRAEGIDIPRKGNKK